VRTARSHSAIRAESVAREADVAEAKRTEQLSRAVNDERAKLARELHDVVAHGMSVVAVRAGVARMVMDKQPSRAQLSNPIVSSIGAGRVATPGTRRPSQRSSTAAWPSRVGPSRDPCCRDNEVTLQGKIGTALACSGKAFIAASGTPILEGRVATEDDHLDPSGRPVPGRRPPTPSWSWRTRESVRHWCGCRARSTVRATATA
jgi:hypothetical protein